MAKQTMAFSSQTIQHRADQKLYHLQVCSNQLVEIAAMLCCNLIFVCDVGTKVIGLEVCDM